MKNNVRNLRKNLGITQDQLAKSLGVSRQTINSIENNKYDPILESAMRLSKILGVPLEQVFFLDDEN